MYDVNVPGLAHHGSRKKIQIIRGVITLNLIGLSPEIAVSVVQSLWITDLGWEG